METVDCCNGCNLVRPSDDLIEKENDLLFGGFNSETEAREILMDPVESETTGAETVTNGGGELANDILDMEEIHREASEHGEFPTEMNKHGVTRHPDDLMRVRGENVDSDDDVEVDRLSKLIHSDTMILIGSLLVMILLGLILRSCFLKLARLRERKKRMRGGIRQIATHMDLVTK